MLVDGIVKFKIGADLLQADGTIEPGAPGCAPFPAGSEPVLAVPLDLHWSKTHYALKHVSSCGARRAGVVLLHAALATPTQWIALSGPPSLAVVIEHLGQLDVSLILGTERALVSQIEKKMEAFKAVLSSAHADSLTFRVEVAGESTPAILVALASLAAPNAKPLAVKVGDQTVEWPDPAAPGALPLRYAADPRDVAPGVAAVLTVRQFFQTTPGLLSRELPPPSGALLKLFGKSEGARVVEMSPAPQWVGWSGTPCRGGPEGKVLYGVGLARNIDARSLRRTTADNEARRALAQLYFARGLTSVTLEGATIDAHFELEPGGLLALASMPVPADLKPEETNPCASARPRRILQLGLLDPDGGFFMPAGPGERWTVDARNVTLARSTGVLSGSVVNTKIAGLLTAHRARSAFRNALTGAVEDALFASPAISVEAAVCGLGLPVDELVEKATLKVSVVGPADDQEVFARVAQDRAVILGSLPKGCDTPAIRAELAHAMFQEEPGKSRP